MDWSKIMFLLRNNHISMRRISAELGHCPGWAGKILNGVMKQPKPEDAQRLAEMVVKFVPQKDWPVDIHDYL
ncbi:MAG: hypothetical protein KGI54_18790 [Pseudomonadota bacterium]|nr:hypothetical protein [Pseudomonadota bacterium]